MKTFIGILISALFLYLAVKDIDISELTRTMQGANLWMIFPLIGMITLFFYIKAHRWKLLLAPIYKTDTKTLLPSMMIGVSVNYLIFGYLGELVRTYLLGRQVKISKTSILATILLERVFDVCSLVLFLGIAWILSESVSRQILHVGYILTAIGLIGLLIIGAMTYWSDACLKTMQLMTHRLPEGFQDKIIGYAEVAISGFCSIKHPKLLIPIVFFSLLLWLSMASCNYIALLAIGIDVPFYAVFLTMALIIVGVTLPNSPGHVGVIEFCYVISLQPYGVDPAQAFTAALFFHVLLYIPVILVSLGYLHHFGLTLSKAKEYAESEHET